MDPDTAITTISLGLKLIDQFRELALRFRRQPVSRPSGMATSSENGDAIEISEAGAPLRSVAAAALKLDEWDEPRYRALETRIRVNWNLFNELFAQNVALAPEETARLNVRMERVKSELCDDFHEMVGTYERILGESLPDHYQLYGICR